MKAKEKKITQSIYMEDELREKLRKKAYLEDRSLNNVVVKILNKYFEKEENKQ